MDNFKAFYSDKRTLITGHTGFKGSWLSEILLGWGAKVAGVSLAPETNPNLHTLLGHQQKFSSYYCDVCDIENLRKILKTEQPEIIFHLAAQPLVRRSYRDPLNTFNTNVMGTATLLELVRECPSVRSIVIITTDKVYKDQSLGYPYREIDALGGYDPYSSSKAAADIVTQSFIQSYFNPDSYKQTHETLVTIGRAGNVIGGGDWSEDRLIPDIVRATFEKKVPVVLRFPKAVRPWEHVLESLSGYLLLGQRGYEGDTSVVGAWNFGPNPQSFVTVEALTRTFQAHLKQGSVIIDPDLQAHEASVLKLDITKSTTKLGWQPTWSYESTVQKTAEWYSTYYQSKNIKEVTEEQINSFFL